MDGLDEPSFPLYFTPPEGKMRTTKPWIVALFAAVSASVAGCHATVVVEETHGRSREEVGVRETGREDQPRAVEAPAAPPQPVVETVTVELRPSSRHVWVPGQWTWDGHWTWIWGHWQLGRSGQTWVAGRWEQSGSSWRWAAGSWREGA